MYNEMHVGNNTHSCIMELRMNTIKGKFHINNFDVIQKFRSIDLMQGGGVSIFW